MNVGIVGAGLIGRLLAWRLVQENCQVTLFDKDNKEGEQSCAYAAGGMLAAFAELEVSEKIICELGMASLKIWPSYLNSLAEPVYYRQNGSLFIAANNDEENLAFLLQRLKQKSAAALNTVQKNTLNNENRDVVKLNASQLLELEPELTHLNHAVYLPAEAHLNPWELLTELKNNLVNKKVTWHECVEVLHIQPYQISTSSHKYNFDCVIDCRGLGAKNDIKTLRGVRGEAMIVYAPEVNLSRPVRLLHPRYRIYIVPRGHHYYYIGASEIENEVNQAMTVRTCLELLSAAYYVHPGFAEACIIKNLVNFRPAMMDNLPYLESSAGLVCINGLYRHGFLLAPALIEKIISKLNITQCEKLA